MPTVLKGGLTDTPVSGGRSVSSLFDLDGSDRRDINNSWKDNSGYPLVLVTAAELTWGENRMRIATLSFFVAIAMIGIRPGIGEADDAQDTEIEAMRKALSKYEDPYVAVRDLYLSTVGCVYYDGTKKEGYMEYPKGAMGVHFVNVTIQGPPDPMKPNVLIYEPVGGKLRLVAAEWLVPLSAAKERPTLLGQPFQGPMEGHEPLIPQAYHHYDLHAWLFKDNPLGMFSPTNPGVSCDEAEYPLLEEATKLVPVP